MFFPCWMLWNWCQIFVNLFGVVQLQSMIIRKMWLTLFWGHIGGALESLRSQGFSELSRRARFRERQEKLRGSAPKVVLHMSGRHKVRCSLTCAIKKFVLVFGGKHVLKLLVLVKGFLSHNVGILLILKLTFSSVFAKYETEKAKQGSRPQHKWCLALSI